MSTSVTAKDVAQFAGVSVGTVSRVFNNYSNVNEDIRQHVLQVAADLGYPRVPLNSASSQAAGRQLKEVGFLYCSSMATTSVMNDPYWASIFYGIEHASRSSNAKIVYRTITGIMHQPHLLTNMLYEMRLEGVMLVGQTTKEIVNVVQKAKLPILLIDNFLPYLGIPVDTILPDNIGGIRLAMEHLIGLGHTRIAFITGPVSKDAALGRPKYHQDIYSLQQRWESYRLALLDHSLPIDDDLLEEGNIDSESGYLACQKLLARNADFSAILCADDATAIGAIKALHDAGLRVPEDISIVGFDNIEMGQHITPALTTVNSHSMQMGIAAFHTLAKRVSDPDAPALIYTIEADLVVRASTSRR